MKYTFPISSLLFLALTTASAQVASHAPTVFKPAPAASGDTGLTQLKPTGKPVASVNGTVLTDVDLVREEYAIFPYARQHNGIPKEMEGGIRSGAMQMMIFEELVFQETQRRKMTIPASRMQQAEAQFHKQFPTPESYSQFIQSDFNGSEKQLEDKIRRSLLIEAFLKTEVDDKSTVSLSETKSFYDSYPGRFEHPETYTFQTITVLPPAKATAEQMSEGRKRIDQALKLAKATKSNDEFGLLAEKLSDDDYRVMEGQHKPMATKDIAPTALAALRAMKVGDVSDVIQIDQAYTILRLNEHALAGKQKFDEVKVDLQKELTKKKNNQLRGELDKKLRASAKIQTL